jgi:predicted metal-dependent hydrolase
MQRNPHLEKALVCIGKRNWFDAHEALEGVWRETENPERRIVQGLIHLVISFEHLRRGNPRGAQAQWLKAQVKLKRGTATLEGIEIGIWYRAIESFYASIDLAGAVAREKMPENLPAMKDWPVPALAATATPSA